MASGLDDFLGSEEPCATFHDARLVSLSIDYGKREVVSEWQLFVGDPDTVDTAERERTRSGKLVLGGLSFWVVDPPTTPARERARLPWLTSDGPLADAATESSERLAPHVPGDSSGWYLFFSDWNAFAYFAAADISFEWCA